uniref:Stereocilin 1 n=1 Tax=Labrus bergylta TaxID=56723 RepID=A0A3Q3KZN9_9LABR
GLDLNAYYQALSDLYAVFQPLLRDRFLDDLPKTLVCILSGRQDCGLEAELTKTVSLELGKPLLNFVSSLRSQSCTTLNRNGGSTSFLSDYLRTGESTSAALDGLQNTLINILSSFPLSGTLMGAVSSLVDATVTYISEFMATLLQVPMDFIKIALQFGIRIPSLEGKQTCEQDLKQLIMGINNNVSWSFGTSIIDILLDIFLAQEQPLCTYPGPECLNPQSVPFQRSVSESKDSTDYYQDILLKCDRHNLAKLNDTLCADILTGSRVGSSTSVLTFCREMSSLSANQVEQVWSNMCYVIQALMSPLFSRSSECTHSPPAVTPPPEAALLPHSELPRVAREASNLRQLACNYNTWLEDEGVDAVLVSLCSDNAREEFAKQVCNNALLMRKLLSEEMNSWLYGYCANSSADSAYLVSQFCVYEQWMAQPSVNPFLLEFCTSLDGPRLTTLICEDTRFFMLLFSNPENGRFMPNCTTLPPIPDMDSIMLESCQYSEWHNVTQITIDVLSECIRLDHIGFTQEVCSNKTFLNSLLLNKENAWLENHCDASLTVIPPVVTEHFSIAGWCDYHTWGERQVDDSVVGLCSQHDQVAFQKNVCCKTSVLQKLLENPQNKWLSSVCEEKEQEYFSIPLSWLRSVLSSAHITTVRLILQYYNRNKDTLQLPDLYLSTMVSVMFQTHLVKDGSLFPELAPLLAAATPADIQALPSLNNNSNRETINRNLKYMTLEQRRAFGLWFSKVMSPSDITRGHESLIRDTGNLIAYLPFHNFQHLSPAQLGNLSCLADPEDLLVYKDTELFSVMREIVMNCTHEGLSLPSILVSSLLLNSIELKVPSSLSSDRLAEIAPLLPLLGVPFLQGLTPSQLHPILPVLSSVSFSPAQLQHLGSLIVGLKTEALLSVTSDRLLSSLPAMAQYTPGLSPLQAHAIATKLWWLDDVEPFLYCTPLLSVMPRTRFIVNNITTATTTSWNTQQAIAIFKKVHETKPNLISQDFSLGTVGQGVSCTVLQEFFRADSSSPAVRRILLLLKQQPGPLHTSVKRCVIEVLYQFEFFSELLKDLGAEIALSMTIKKFPKDMMDTLRRMIIQEPQHFLMLARTKQELLVDKVVQRMGMYTGVFTEEEFISLGIMAPFVVDEVLIQLDRSFFTENLDYLQGLCYSSGKMNIVARILQDPAAFDLMTVGCIEKLFMSQRQWERGDVGSHCLNENDKRRVFEKQQFVLQFFLGFLKVPTCEILHTTAPSAWTSSSLISMTTSAFSNCLELMGQDPFSLITQLGWIATELSVEELSSLRLTERRSIAAMGAISVWTNRQLAALFSAILNSTKQSPSQLDYSTLGAMGYIVCGAKTTDINVFNAVEFKAVLQLGQLKLSCSEEQLLAFIELLTHSFAFGPTSSWGTDVFIEIGVLAGIPDMAMSALVKMQIEGIIPVAISMIPADKFAVVFNQKHISMFFYEQAAAVTEEQLSKMSDVQKTALSLVLTPWEARPVDFR